MATVQLTAKELEYAAKALQYYVSELRGEIVDTDNPSYKVGLKDERAALEAVLAKLKAAMPEKGTA
jgi:hypothetical protein